MTPTRDLHDHVLDRLVLEIKGGRMSPSDLIVGDGALVIPQGLPLPG
jgi:hypothetical protein